MKLGQLTRRGRGREGIDIGPLIDIIFILLIFFMVSTTFVRNQELGIERPQAASAEQADVKALRIAVDRGGQIVMDGQSVQPWMVQSRVRERLSRHPQLSVLVTADQRLEAGRLIEVVDQCRLAGATKVAVDVVKGR